MSAKLKMRCIKNNCWSFEQLRKYLNQLKEHPFLKKKSEKNGVQKKRIQHSEAHRKQGRFRLDLEAVDCSFHRGIATLQKQPIKVRKT